MREYKFRAWCKNKNTMIENYVTGVDSYGELNVAHFHSSAYNASSVPNLVLMQYTGLNDKNGKEVYEGDVVKVYINSSSDDYLRLEANYLDNNKWRNEDAYILLKISIPETYYEEWCDNGEKIEIIGNIYEHPELLSEN